MAVWGAARAREEAATATVEVARATEAVVMERATAVERVEDRCMRRCSYGPQKSRR